MARVVSNEVLEKFLKQELPTNQLEYTGHFGGGCINEGQSFKTDLGVLFVKTNKKDGVSNLMQNFFAYYFSFDCSSHFDTNFIALLCSLD